MGEPVYTVFVRVPIPRNGFVDPPPVNWDSAKDAALWKILSGAAQEEIDWNEMADRFEVTVEFLLQQVAYLTERHASNVRAQVRKATAAAKGSAAPSPMPTVDAPLNRPSPAVSISREAPPGQNDGGYIAALENPQNRPNISRNTSGSTIQKEQGTASPRRRLSSLPLAPQTTAFSPVLEKHISQSVSSTTSDALSDDSGEEDESLPAQSRIIRRPPRFQQAESEQPYGYGDDEESEPAFQPFKSTGDHNAAHDLASTLKDEGQIGAKRGIKYTGKYSQISDSSGGSGVIGTAGNRPSDQSPASALSPRRKAELAGRSPSSRSKGQSQEGSEGTPSMGSSFSDLDDASVTQSALEEALASHLQGGASSRFSISQAFRSRYTPSSNK